MALSVRLPGIRAVALVAIPITLATSVVGAVPTRAAFGPVPVAVAIISVPVTFRASVPISVAVIIGIPVSVAIPLAAVSVAFIPVAVIALFGRGGGSRDCNAQALAEIDLKPDGTG
ncbi:hypothetical protein [Microvirga zambiensis]|uniref:hypothetical protein n=1 Tax=Microvirga zambiensis TaxID=1402137 RepID=UPI00191CB1F8|nr:hypothetical protein [Microvirga zambiensis]